MNLQAAIDAVTALHEEREGVARTICGHCTDLVQFNSQDPYFEIAWPCATMLRLEAAGNE